MAALGTPIAAVSLNYFARLYICVQPGFLHGLFVQPPAFLLCNGNCLGASQSTVEINLQSVSSGSLRCFGQLA